MFANLTPIVRNLLLINIVVYLLNSFLGDFLNEKLAFYSYLSDNFAPYQLVTYMFLHGSWMHLFSNMFGLFIFGPLLERFWGGQKFLKFYLITGIGAGILYSLINLYEFKKLENTVDTYVESPAPEEFFSFLRDYYPNYTRDNQISDVAISYAENPDNRSYEEDSIAVVNQLSNWTINNSSMLGASGAIFGILMAFGLLFPNTELFLLFPPMPIKAKYLVIFYGLYSLYGGIEKASGDNVAHFAHLGGMLVAFILLKIWQDDRGNFY